VILFYLYAHIKPPPFAYFIFYWYCCSRERNRKHAKHTRLRKKAHLDCIRQEISKLEDENRTMRNILSRHSPTLSAVVCEMPDSIRSLTFEEH